MEYTADATYNINSSYSLFFILLDHLSRRDLIHKQKNQEVAKSTIRLGRLGLLMFDEAATRDKEQRGDGLEFR
jgi:hypothetical protein